MSARRRAGRILATVLVLGVDLASATGAVHLLSGLPAGVPAIRVLSVNVVGLTGIGVLILTGAGRLNPRHPADGLGTSSRILIVATLVSAAINLYGPAGALVLLMVAGDFRTSEAPNRGRPSGLRRLKKV